MRVKALLSLVLGFAAFISAQTVECPAPQCDSGDGDGQYACGVCDPSDPQLCVIGGIQHACTNAGDPNYPNDGGGSCISTCYYFTGTAGAGSRDPYTQCC
ncbi:hypothetical protein M438DRAFT_343713 [Aureobasidium pullulans EXF-150]|uniref:Uncharacterized protein n=1 Tax=Aureobasidium pullulans EXF-150 TaxID=1043002 RepID=A0A074XUP4_AURPU|nr:uncharacterized protein M438DRAFT_343713 [Aureobasidium pullulans EXF-150]KEQ87354.1 hypothetical protein M438DRAFT_343713 [Aureobasidium pullulans EXF-150]